MNHIRNLDLPDFVIYGYQLLNKGIEEPLIALVLHPNLSGVSLHYLTARE